MKECTSGGTGHMTMNGAISFTQIPTDSTQYSTQFYMCDPDPSGCVTAWGRVWEITFPRIVLPECHDLQISFSDLQCNCTSCHQWNLNTGQLMWHCYLHQHQRQHSSTQDTSGQSYSPDPSSRNQKGLRSRLASSSLLYHTLSPLAVQATLAVMEDSGRGYIPTLPG